MAEPIPLAELELRIALLPPIGRAAHLAGPTLHARRLVQLWRGGEMTSNEIREASDDELIARRTILTDSAEAKAIDAALRARKRSKPIELAKPAPESPVLAGVTLDAVKDYLREIELAKSTKPPPPETPKPSDRADHWSDDDVPLSQAFRLLGVEEVARAIARTALMSDNDYPNDPDHWPLPPLNDLLPELQATSWQAILDGELRVEAIRYARGKIGANARLVPPIELARLSPDWALSRLCRGDLDEFVEARVRRAPIETPVEPPVETLRRQRPSRAELKGAMEEIERGYPKDARPPPFRDIEDKLRARYPGVTQKQARATLKFAPRLRGKRGRPPPLKSSG